MFVPRGVDVPSLNQDKNWLFSHRTDKALKVGDPVGGGDIIGYVKENNLFEQHSIMIPPKITGKIKDISNRRDGQYTVGDSVAVVETYDGREVDITLRHFWPVRNPRPIVSKL